QRQASCILAEDQTMAQVRIGILGLGMALFLGGSGTRAAAAWALGRVKADPAIVVAPLCALLRDGYAQERQAAASALSRLDLDPKKVLVPLTDALKDSDPA